MSPQPRRRRLEVEDIGDITVVNFVDKKILDEQNIQVIGEQLFQLVDELGRRKVLLNFKNVEFLSSAALGKLITLNRKLQSAGVRFCISTGNSGSAVRNLPLYAGMAAAFGLPKAEALKAVTLYPAQIMNVADRMGSIEPGKMANIVVTDGDLLEVRTHVRYLFIDGVRLPLTSRHTELYDAFKDRK